MYDQVTDKQIRDYYSICNGNQYSASKHFCVGVRRILRVWDENSLKPTGKLINMGGNRGSVGRKPKLNPEVFELVASRRFYDRYSGDPILASDSLPSHLDYKHIFKIWKKQGYPIIHRRNYRISNSLEDKV